MEKDDPEGNVTHRRTFFDTRTSAAQLPHVVLGWHPTVLCSTLKPQAAQNRGKLRWGLKGEQKPEVQDGLCGRKDPAQARELRKKELFLQGEKWKRCF